MTRTTGLLDNGSSQATTTNNNKKRRKSEFSTALMLSAILCLISVFMYYIPDPLTHPSTLCLLSVLMNVLLLLDSTSGTSNAKVKKQGLSDEDNDEDEDDENEEDEDQIDLVELGGKRERGRGTKAGNKGATKAAKSGATSGAAFLQQYVASIRGTAVEEEEVSYPYSYFLTILPYDCSLLITTTHI